MLKETRSTICDYLIYKYYYYLFDERIAIERHETNINLNELLNKDPTDIKSNKDSKKRIAQLKHLSLPNFCGDLSPITQITNLEVLVLKFNLCKNNKCDNNVLIRILPNLKIFFNKT